MKRYLITGGCGFIGTTLAKKLKDNSDNEIVLIDLEQKITDYHKTNFSSLALDIRNFDNFNKLQNEKFDCVFHLAAQTSGRISEENPELDIDTNIKGTLNLLRWMRQAKNNKIIFTSSMASYGNCEAKIAEEYPQNPLSNYGVSKVACEKFLKMYSQYGIQSTIFRLFNVYGCGQDMKNMKQGMASIYIAQAIKSNTIKVTGGLDRYRDFVHVSDVVNALIAPLSNDSMWGNVYNVGTGIKTTVKELIEIIAQTKGEKLKTELLGSHDGDQFGTFADYSKLANTGWKPEVKLQDGILEMYRWALENE